MTAATQARMWVIAAGPVADAVRILATETTLAEHVTVHDSPDLLRVEVTDTVPMAVWGSGTRALWDLACAIAYSGETVSLYRVASALDACNTRAARRALYELFGGAR